MLLNAVVYADDKEKPPTISASLYKKLTKVEAFIADRHYSQARKMLGTLLGDVKANSYEQAISLRSLASVYALENNYMRATALLEQCLAIHKLPNTQEHQALLNLGQLYMANNQYQSAVTTLERWLQYNVKKEKHNVLVLLANAHAQLKHYRKALPYIKQVIANSRTPKESWLQLNLALYYELNQYKQAVVILKKLIVTHPDKKNYWQQLTNSYQHLKKFSHALSVQVLAYEKGFLNSESALLQLVNLYLYTKQPYQGATLLNKALKANRIAYNATNLELLATAWTHAREYKRAIQSLEKASVLHEKGRLYLQLGRIYVEQERWEDAIKRLNLAIKKSGLKRQLGEAYILLGMSYYELNNIVAARRTFKKALGMSRSKKSARQWLNYI